MLKYLCLMACVLGAVVNSSADPIERPSNGLFGLKAGYVEGSDIDASWTEYETDGGLSVGLFADQSVSRHMSLGFYLEFDEVIQHPEEKWMMGLGMTIKAGFPGADARWAFRPGVGIGYAFVEGASSNKDRMHFGTVRGSAEVIHFLNRRMGVLAELSLVAAPVGGSSSRWRTMDPRLSGRIGFVF